MKFVVIFNSGKISLECSAHAALSTLFCAGPMAEFACELLCDICASSQTFSLSKVYFTKKQTFVLTENSISLMVCYYKISSRFKCFSKKGKYFPIVKLYIFYDLKFRVKFNQKKYFNPFFRERCEYEFDKSIQQRENKTG